MLNPCSKCGSHPAMLAYRNDARVMVCIRCPVCHERGPGFQVASPGKRWIDEDLERAEKWAVAHWNDEPGDAIQ